MTGDLDAPLTRALVEEACRKSSLVWLRPAGADRSVAAWHVFIDGAVHVVGGGLEQDLPDLADGDEVEVTVRSKDNGGRLVSFTAAATTIAPGDATWVAVVPELHSKRLNPPDGEAQPDRWARKSRVVRLEPTGRVTERPGSQSQKSQAAEPPGSPATTRGPLPFVIGRRATRRR